MYEGNAPYRPRYVLPDYAEGAAAGIRVPRAATADRPRRGDHLPAGDVRQRAVDHRLPGLPRQLRRAARAVRRRASTDAELYRGAAQPLGGARPHPARTPSPTPTSGRTTPASRRTVLRVAAELQQVVPNLTLRVDPERTPDDLVLDAVRTVFACGGPHFVNHPMMTGRPRRAVRRRQLLQLAARRRRRPHARAAQPQGGRAPHRRRGRRRSSTRTLPTYVELTGRAGRRPDPTPGRDGRVLRALLAGARRA